MIAQCDNLDSKYLCLPILFIFEQLLSLNLKVRLLDRILWMNPFLLLILCPRG